MPPNLDAESLRSEITEAPDAHGLTTEQVAAITALPDQEIDAWIQELAARDDAFWAAYDNLRRRVIARLNEIVGLSEFELDPLAPEPGGLHVEWEIDADDGGLSPAQAAIDIWRRVFRRGTTQPSAGDACVFLVSSGHHAVQVDLSEERYAHLFDG